MAEGTTPKLDLSSSPPIFILPSHLTTAKLHEIEDQVFSTGAPLTYDAKEAQVFLGQVSQKKRATFDLKAKGVWTEEARLIFSENGEDGEDGEPARKKAKVDTAGSSRRRGVSPSSSPSTASTKSSLRWPDLTSHIMVLKLAWLDACIKKGRPVPYTPYVVYTAKRVDKPADELSPTQLRTTITYIKANPDGSPTHNPPNTNPRSSRRRFGTSSSPTGKIDSPPPLHRSTTSDLEETISNPLPPLPAWATGQYAIYACCRSTPLTSPNASFIKQLSIIKEARTLTLDDIGVRAYSTSIASIAAYPHPITRADEITRLPGCEAKIAQLWSEWFHSAETDADRHIKHVQALENDADLKILRLFYEIWGVGADTARKFYYDRGWRELDDVIEYGWDTLTRVQQIGVKFYEEFKVKIPRAEVEEIADVVHMHARRVCDISGEDEGGTEDVVCVVVGGYRRGKAESGDVDLILSHRSEEKTQDLVVDVVRSLEGDGYITHTLSLHTTTSDRGQQTLPFRSSGVHGHGFDSLDKALCVWQDPNFEAPNQAGKNPNVHRRVDIIVCPWRTVGCGILGWSGGTTFQRDIRRFATKVKGWKFDSSGVRDRGKGSVIDLEKPVKGDTGDTWQDRERRLMEGLGIGYRDAPERCTG